MKHYFVVLKMQFLSTPAEDGTVGILPVFETREQAEEAFPGEKIATLAEREYADGGEG